MTAHKRRRPPPADWPCEAYGAEALAFGARCFFADLQKRDCIDPEDCHARMGEERQRIFRAIQEHAAAGEPVYGQLADDFPTPGDLLGGNE